MKNVLKLIIIETALNSLQNVKIAPVQQRLMHRLTCFSMTVDSELDLCARCVDKFKKMEISELFVVVIGALFADKYLAECSIVG